MAAYTAIDDPEAYFQVKTYTGDGAGSLALTLDGDTDMQPDLVWIKNRSSGENHALVDAVRGVGKQLLVNTNAREYANANSVSAFNSDGFTVGDLSDTNGSGNALVAWCWKESAVSGMDIIGYEGNATNRTISHSLSAVPHFIIIKNRDSTGASGEHWLVYHKSIDNTHGLLLNETNAKIDDATYFQDTDPTSSVFSIGTADRANKNTEDNISYAWSEKQGFSKFGSFVGNGDNDGAFVFLGFRPAYVIVKRSSTTGNWVIWDNKRQTFNLLHKRLYTNLSDTEYDGDALGVDFLSNGFKIRTSTAEWNGDGDTMVYMAFAEAPLVNSEGVPANAR